MLIKDKVKDRSLIAKIRLILFVILYSGLVFSFGVISYRSGTLERVLKTVLFNSIDTTKNFFRGFTARTEYIRINVKYVDYQKLAYKREIALERKILFSSPEDYVPATIEYKDKIIKADIRLKGDNPDHFQGDRWSFRIKIKSDNTLFGMKRFSIQHPRTRHYIYEWIFHQALKREDITSLRYEFIKVTLNGKDLGIYALEEHFEKRLIENNRNREGLVLKFNKDIVWGDLFIHGLESPTDLQSVFSLDISAFKMNTILNNPSLYKQFIIAKDLLEAFRNGRLSAHEVFDIKKLAKFFALSELLGGLHGAGQSHFDNWRFYYNPITSLLEPIGFDADAGQDLKRSWVREPVRVIKDPPDTYHALIFSDIIFFEEYMKVLEQISKRSYLDRLFKDIDIDLQKNLNILYSQYPYFIFSKDVFYQNQKYIQSLLTPYKGMHAYYHTSCKTRIELELGNIQSLPIKILGLSYKDSLFFPVSKKTILLPRIPSRPINYQMINFSFPEDFVWRDSVIRDLRVKYRLLGTSPVRYETVFPYSHLSDNFIKNDFIRQSPNVHEFEFLSLDESAKKIFIKPGDWNLDQNLIIPGGYKVVCGGNTKLNILNSAKILSYSPLEFIGLENSPIVIYSKDLTGQGIVVMNAEQKSILKYVVFNNLSNPSQGGWELTGAVTFFESPVEINDCQFLNNNSEDGLNIVRSDFSIDKSLFSKSSSDAIDTDFSKGEITNSSFIDCGNDAIDTSGSLVELRNIFINGAGDKGLSIGENSEMTADAIEIKNVTVAIASKDMSELNVDNAKISNSKVGFAVYQKKSEFGPASITVIGLTINNIDILHLVEKESELNIKGRKVKSKEKNVKEILSKYIEL